MTAMKSARLGRKSNESLGRRAKLRNSIRSYLPMYEEL